MTNRNRAFLFLGVSSVSFILGLYVSNNRDSFFQTAPILKTPVKTKMGGNLPEFARSLSEVEKKMNVLPNKHIRGFSKKLPICIWPERSIQPVGNESKTNNARVNRSINQTEMIKAKIRVMKLNSMLMNKTMLKQCLEMLLSAKTKQVKMCIDFLKLNIGGSMRAGSWVDKKMIKSRMYKSEIRRKMLKGAPKSTANISRKCHSLMTSSLNRNKGATDINNALSEILTIRKGEFPLKKNELLTIGEAPNITVDQMDCRALILGDKNVMTLAKSIALTERPQPSPTDAEVEQLATNCSNFKVRRQYILKPVSTEEFHFPLAFSLIVYKEANQVERLLRAIYRPQNYYCIHVDLKADRAFLCAMHTISACFENVFVSPKKVNVSWGEFSVLEAEMACLEELWKYQKWRYFINLTGQEFPLKTIGDIVKILKSFNGANDAPATLYKNWRKIRHVKVAEEEVPYGIRLGKGQVHVALSRAFVEFALHQEIAQRFYHWLNGTKIPDETFFSSLNISPLAGVPGAFTGEPATTKENLTQIVRYKKWSFLEACHGKSVRQVCISTTQDLPEQVKSPMLFVNKFHANYHPLAYDCLEEHIAGQVREEVMGTHPAIDLGFYKKLPFVLHHTTRQQKSRIQPNLTAVN